MEKKNIIKFNILAILCIIVFAFAVSPVSLQNDTFYTIKIGEHILQNGITAEEPFAWHEGLKYTYPHWAYDVLIHLIYNVGGQVGIYLSTVVLAAIMGMCIYLTSSKLTKNNLISFLMTLLAMYLMRDFIAARAQLVTFILFILTIFFIEKFLETKKKRYALALIVIPIIISNVHSAVFPFYFVLYLPYVAEYIISILAGFDVLYYKQKIKKQEKIIEKEKDINDPDLLNILNDRLEEYKSKLAKREERKTKIKPYKIIIEKNDATKWLIVIAIICAFTGLLTPIGDMPYTYLTRITDGNTTQSINEHLPLTIAHDKEFATLFVITLLIYIFTPVKMKLRDWFMLGGLVMLAFITRRQESMVYLIGLVILTKAICDLIAQYDEHGTEEVMGFINTVCGKIIVLAVVLIISLVMIKPKLEQKFVPENAYPIKACDYILENVDVDNMKIFNDYNYGSYLLFRDIPVFIDSRCDLYTPEFNEGIDIFSDFINISNMNVEYENKFKEYGITHVIQYKNSKLASQLRKDSNYNVIYEDDNFTVLERLTKD